MRKAIVILPILAGAVAVPANAQEFGTGARAELRAGYDEVNVGVSFNDGVDQEKTSENGLAIGAEIGFDARVTEGLVAGVYAGIESSQIEGCGELFNFDDEVEEDEVCLKAGRNLTVGARLGIPTGDGGLVYAKGGYSSGKVTASYTDFVETFEDSDTVGGWHIGGGFEANVTGNIYVKGEYVHTNYGKLFEGELEDDSSIRATRHQLIAGVGMRFGAR